MACAICGAKTERNRRTCDACREAALRVVEDTAPSPQGHVQRTKPLHTTPAAATVTLVREEPPQLTQESRGDAAARESDWDDEVAAYREAIRQAQEHLHALQEKLRTTLDARQYVPDEADQTLLAGAPSEELIFTNQPASVFAGDTKADTGFLREMRNDPKQAALIVILALCLIAMSLFMIFQPRLPRHITPIRTRPIPMKDGSRPVPLRNVFTTLSDAKHPERSVS